MAETIGGVTTNYGYTYDVSGRLTQVTKNSVTDETFTYDNNNNVTASTSGASSYTGTYDNQDRMLTYKGYSFGHNINGEMTSKQNSTTLATTTYAYNLMGYMTDVTLASADVISYYYDGQGRRVSRELNGTPTNHFIYDGQYQIVGELDASGGVGAKYIYVSQSNSPDYMVKSGVTYKFIKNHLGSIRLVVNTSTGAIVQRIDYDTYGKVTSDTNPGFQPFGFAGGLYDHQTGLVRFGARDYDGEVGRWTSKDPILFNGGDTNLFGYVQNDPINFVDPSGLKLEFGSSQARQQLSGSMAQIWSTPAGKSLISQLNGSSQVYFINVNSSSEHYQQGNMVTVDPNDFPGVNASPLGVIPASTTRILGHELGHLTGTVDNGNLNVNMWENPIMKGLGGFPRTSYGTSGVRCGR